MELGHALIAGLPGRIMTGVMSESKRPPLTPRQRDVLEEIWRLESRTGAVTPLMISEGLGMQRQNVHTYVVALRDHGLVTYDAQERQRAIIQLTDAGYHRLDKQPPSRASDLALPIIGEVAAGAPGYADEFVEGYATRLQDLLSLKEGDFLLRVRGDSMTGIGIYPGDYVVIHPTATEPRNGEIALVAVPGEDTATLKRWHRNNGTVTLQSENPDYPPMTFKTRDVLVQGCLVGHVGSAQARNHR